MASGNKVHRRASHAGSWYSSSKKELSYQLESWLAEACDESHGPAKAIISPHAGYQYCGPCAAHAYKEIDPSTTKRIFILGPSHHIRLSGCALSPASVYETPLGKLNIDQGIYNELYETTAFETMTIDADEDEHSIEMQLSFIAKIMEPKGLANFTVVPILVGSLSNEREELYGRLFSDYLLDPDNVFVISSDFCHWGSRFSYQYYDKGWGDIHQSIKKLDEIGMDLIESLDPLGFSSYLRKYHNTICGRHPIAVLLNAVHHLQSQNKATYSMRFLNYAQSNQCLRMNESSVSYASATLKLIE